MTSKEGWWFHKKGRSLTTTHRRRYFQIEKDALVWRIGPEDRMRHGQLSLGQVHEVELVIGSAEKKVRAYGCRLRTANNRIYELETEDAGEARSFVDAIVKEMDAQEAETSVVYHRRILTNEEDSSSSADSGFLADEVEEVLSPEEPTTQKAELLRSWSSKRIVMSTTKKSIFLQKEKEETMLYYRIRERQHELAQVAKTARKRAQDAARLVGQTQGLANLDALSTIALFSQKKEHNDLYKEVKAHLNQISTQERLLTTRHAPNLLYAAQLHDVAARHYAASLQAGWARCGTVSTHLQVPTDRNSWQKRWADERDWGLTASPSPSFLVLSGSRLRAFPTSGNTLTELGYTEARGEPLNQAKKECLADFNGEKVRLTLGKRVLRVDRSCGRLAATTDDLEALAVIEAETALRLDRASRPSLEPPFVILVSDLTTVSIAPKAKLPVQKRGSFYDRMTTTTSSNTNMISRDEKLDLRSFGLGLSTQDQRLTFRLSNATDAVAWALDLSSGAQRRCALLDIPNICGATVRSSLAPKAPAEAFDLLLRDDIYTFVPDSLQDKCRWLVALEAAARLKTTVPVQKHDDDQYLNETRHLLNTQQVVESTPPKEEAGNEDDELHDTTKLAAQCLDEDQAKALAQKLRDLERKAMDRAAVARETAVALRRRLGADQEKKYLARPTTNASIKASNANKTVAFCRSGHTARDGSIEARHISHELALGRMVLVSLVSSSPQLKFEFNSLDPLSFEHETNTPTLFARYQNWKTQFSLKTPESVFQEAVQTLIADQAERWQAALAALQLRHDNSSVLAFIRLLDGPEEYARPPRDGDVAIIFSAGVADKGFDAKFTDRTQTSAPVVAAAISWLDRNRALAQRFLRVDSDSTDQDEHSPLAYARVMRLLFQQAVLR